MERREGNTLIADRLREAATLLEEQDANPYRLNAYRRAADAIDSLPEDISAVFQRDGFHALTDLPGVGPQIADAILEMIRTGRWVYLERLRGSHDPEALFTDVPGMGPKLARQVIEQLHLDTLEGLEAAAHDGRLERVPGFGERRTAIVRAALADKLSRGRRRVEHSEEPPAEMLLELDREYREKAAANKLRRIVPKRFNPNNVAWLPILHAERGRWHFSVLFSNTALAHRLGRTKDWVVIYFHSDSTAEGQRTVVTETQGPLRGKRVVRGRENECAGQPLLWPEPTSAA